MYTPMHDPDFRQNLEKSQKLTPICLHPICNPRFANKPDLTLRIGGTAIVVGSHGQPGLGRRSGGRQLGPS